jgi:hypothetical protein
MQGRVVRRELVSNAASECDAGASLPANSHSLPFANDRLNLQPSIDPQRALARDAAATAPMPSGAGAQKNPLDELAALIDGAWRDYASGSAAADAIPAIPPAAAADELVQRQMERAVKEWE